MYFVYPIKSKKFNKFYIGFTRDIKRRLKRRNGGIVTSTKPYRPWNLVYYEAYLSKQLAELRKKRLKQYGNSLKELKKRAGVYPPLKSGAGFSLPEILIAVTLAVILFSSTLYMLRPEEFRMKGRDARRLSDLGFLKQAIVEYHLDTGDYPDMDGIIRKSDESFGGEFQSTDGTGWIPVNLSQYLTKLYSDPLNSGDFVYRYKKSGEDYEIDAKMEEDTGKMLNSYDGGDDNDRYEVGTDLTLL